MVNDFHTIIDVVTGICVVKAIEYLAIKLYTWIDYKIKSPLDIPNHDE